MQKTIWIERILNVSKKFCFNKNRADRGYPSLAPSEDLDWRGFCKKSLQTLENTELAAYVAAAACTAFALTMTCLLNLRVKVRSHRVKLWKNPFGTHGFEQAAPEKPLLILPALRALERPLFHGAACVHRWSGALLHAAAWASG
jgi:hypothetical protein